jgi:CRISPR-associated endonuclease/helicase Cas3
MIGVLKASSELLSHYNISTLFMSATPTMGYIESLKEVLSPAIQKLEEEYRKLQRHKISLEEEIEEFVLKNIDKIRNKFKGGQKILIITNTVPKAVNIYKMLNGLSELKGNIGLLHSRFAYKDRIEREKELELKKKRVIVATQVAEVSLDITSDEIITEVAPLPSIIQRLGRVNRYDRKTDRTNAWICKTKDPHPYSPLEIRETQRVLGELVENIEEKGEGAYLETLAQYEFNLLQVVDESYKKFRKRLEDNNFFYACKAGKEEFGREMNLPAIPQCYSNHTRDILQKIRLSTNYSKCKYLYAEIKKHILPLPAHLQKRLKDVYVWDEELQCFVGVSGDPYDSSLGLVID